MGFTTVSRLPSLGPQGSFRLPPSIRRVVAIYTSLLPILEEVGPTVSLLLTVYRGSVPPSSSDDGLTMEEG